MAYYAQTAHQRRSRIWVWAVWGRWCGEVEADQNSELSEDLKLVSVSIHPIQPEYTILPKKVHVQHTHFNLEV
jgi:hypothetical protein